MFDSTLMQHVLHNTSSRVNWANYATLLTSIGTFILFGLTFMKELIFHNKNVISQQNRFKFENAHAKTVQLSEDFVVDLYNIFNEIQSYRKILQKNGGTFPVNPPMTVSDSRIKIEIGIANLHNKLKYAELYIDKSIVKLITNVANGLCSFYHKEWDAKSESTFRINLDDEISVIIEQLKKVITGNL